MTFARRARRAVAATIPDLERNLDSISAGIVRGRALLDRDLAAGHPADIRLELELSTQKALADHIASEINRMRADIGLPPRSPVSPEIARHLAEIGLDHIEI